MVTSRLADPDPAAPEPMRVTVRHLVALFVWSVIILAFLFFFGPWKLVLLGLLAACCLGAILRPALRRLPGPRPLKGFLLGIVPLLVCCGLVYLAVSLLIKPIQGELKFLPQSMHQFDAWLAGLSNRFGMSQPLTLGQIWTAVHAHIGGGLLQGLTGNLIDLAIGTVFVFIGTIYLMAEPSESVIPPLLGLLPPNRRAQARSAIDVLEPRLRWWLIGALITATIIGLTSLLGFWLIGLKLFVPLAILAGISEFVPTIGPALAFLVALAFAATQGADKVLWLCGLYAVVHILESYILIPLVYKEAVRVPPIVTLFTVVLWGEIFGIGGLLLAIPINLVLWTLAEHFVGNRTAVAVVSAANSGEPLAPPVAAGRL
ncbi:MAG TPA: AI-2E family transporter [Tepidisphaeraceae bacterium]|nr:AI-2E family transporter [Tepidisphaeraceae bacterium]